MKKHILTIVLALSLALTITSCGLSNNQSDNTSPPSASQSESSTDEPPGDLSSSSNSVQNPADPAQEDGTVRTDFTVDFFGEASRNPMSFSLNLPANWYSDPSGIFDEAGNWIASVELHKVTDAEQPFSDIDEINNGVVFSKELVVSGYPAKCYVLELGEDGGDVHTRTQYLYYIVVDDAYVLIFFSPQGTTERKDDEFDKIVSSFIVAES